MTETPNSRSHAATALPSSAAAELMKQTDSRPTGKVRGHHTSELTRRLCADALIVRRDCSRPQLSWPDLAGGDLDTNDIAAALVYVRVLTKNPWALLTARLNESRRDPVTRQIDCDSRQLD